MRKDVVIREVLETEIFFNRQGTISIAQERGVVVFPVEYVPKVIKKLQEMYDECGGITIYEDDNEGGEDE